MTQSTEKFLFIQDPNIDRWAKNILILAMFAKLMGLDEVRLQAPGCNVLRFPVSCIDYFL